MPCLLRWQSSPGRKLSLPWCSSEKNCLSAITGFFVSCLLFEDLAMGASAEC